MRISIANLLSTRKKRIIALVLFIIADIAISIGYTFQEQVDVANRVFDWVLFIFSFIIIVPGLTLLFILSVLFALFIIKIVYKFTRWLITK